MSGWRLQPEAWWAGVSAVGMGGGDWDPVTWGWAGRTCSWIRSGAREREESQGWLLLGVAESVSRVAISCHWESVGSRGGLGGEIHGPLLTIWEACRERCGEGGEGTSLGLSGGHQPSGGI